MNKLRYIQTVITTFMATKVKELSNKDDPQKPNVEGKKPDTNHQWVHIA